MPVIEGATGTIIPFAGVPAAGTDEVQTITIGGTPTSGTFTLTFQGATTAAIPWNSTNATLIASIDTALEALSTIGAGGVTTAAGTVTAGIGTITVTFAGNLGKKAVPTMTADGSALVGTSPTVAVAETTPGVDATLRGAGKGALLMDTSSGLLYANTGTAQAPTWTKVGLQS